MRLFVEELPWRAPEDCFAALSGTPHLAFFDSAAPGDARSRSSYFCLDPLHVLRFADGQATIDGAVRVGDPLDLLAEALADCRAGPAAAPVAFSGGAVGFFGYELGLNLEQLATRHPNPFKLPDMVFGIYDTVVGFDHGSRRAWLLIRDRPGTDPAGRAAALRSRLEVRAPRAAAPRAQAWRNEAPRAAAPRLAWRPDFHRRTYRSAVQRALDYIRAGDIYQANITMRHRATRPPELSMVSLYLALRKASPAPFAAYLDCGDDLALLSASPERFVSLDTQRRIEARPIKGTRPRHPDPGRDAVLAAALFNSAKDRAENLMIVDLLRNDIGRVAEIGSIAVPELCRVESFASVHHMVSSITATLRPELGAIDLLRATLPGGSVTGAPKIRAMQIIDELEACRRGPYCGAIAWIGFDGAMDSSIVIRTIIATPTQLLAQAGGGIVADSDPQAEYEEMMLKAAAMLRVRDV